MGVFDLYNAHGHADHDVNEPTHGVDQHDSAFQYHDDPGVVDQYNDDRAEHVNNSHHHADPVDAQPRSARLQRRGTECALSPAV